jgi:hypothetical protein
MASEFIQALEELKKGNKVPYRELYQSQFEISITDFLKGLFPDRKFVVNVGMWSYTSQRLLDIYPIWINVSTEEQAVLEERFKNLSEVVEDFSLTELIVQNGKNVSFHFSRHNNKDINATPITMEKKAPIIKDTATLNERNGPLLIEFLNGLGLSEYKTGTIKDYEVGLKKCFKVAVSDILTTDPIKNLYFMTVESGAVSKKVAGVQAIYTDKAIEIEELFKMKIMVEHFARGLMAPFWMEELDILQRLAYLRSAIAAIMGRNLSHNIGSHVLARISTPQMADDALFSKEKVITETTKKQAAERLTKLNAFLRMRMDFVADIATAQKPPPPMKMTLLSEVLLPLTGQFLLWRFLCASHDLTERDISFRLIIKGNSSIQLAAGKSLGDQYISPSRLPSELSTLAAAIPNGAVGCQALYCIIENLTRNTVKHARRRDKQQIEVAIEIDPDNSQNEHLMKLVIYDNWEACANLVAGEKLDDQLNRRIAEPLITEENILLGSNRGLKEMKAAAAYLRGLMPEYVDTKVDPPLLEAVCEGDNLGFALYLLKPRDLFVFDGHDAVNERKRGLLRKQGIEVSADRDSLHERAGNHSMLLLRGNSHKEFDNLQPCATDLPTRILIQSDKEVRALCGNWSRSDSSPHAKVNVEKIWDCLKHERGLEASTEAWKLWISMISQNSNIRLRVAEHMRRSGWDIKDLSQSVSTDLQEGHSNLILYARHGHPRGRSSNVIFYEPYNQGVDPISFVLENPPEDETAKRKMIYKLLEAGLMPVIIIDERIQEGAQSIQLEFSAAAEPDKKMPLHTCLNLMRVYVPSKEKLDLEARNLTEDSIKQWIEAKIKQIPGISPPPMLVIHQGILDIIGLQEAWKAREWIDSFNEKISEVIVTSGRGVPDNLPRGARFIPLSTIALYALERKSKFHLVQALLASRSMRK